MYALPTMYTTNTTTKCIQMDAAVNLKKRIYLFGGLRTEGNSSMKSLLGGKGANLAEMMTVLKLPVPYGFTVTTEACVP